ncbi:MAG: protein phosphatase 2C domain-containing protein [Streptosporangiaceae bacterium]
MRISLATARAPGRANEDYVGAGRNWAIILDGATAPDGVDSGCVHDVRWLVRRLAAGLSGRLLATGSPPLADLLAGAIAETCAAHSGTCDLANPDSPSATVSVVRAGPDRVDYLTLADSPVVLWYRDQTFTAVTDDRIARLPGGRPYSGDLVRAHRNKAPGFWVASTQPEAAYQAITGEVPFASVSEIGLFTDGVTRLLDWYGWTWPEVFSRLRSEGPQGLIARVRAAERDQPRRHEKPHDDASAIYLNLS